MTIERQAGSERKFVQVTLPWLAAAGALVVYLLTLNHWVSLKGLLSVAKLSGWTWQPEISGPLCWLLTCPLRALPTSLIPIAVNLFSTVCAVLTLALLARSAALLPQDRTQEQRDREQHPQGLLSIPSAWLPPVLAVLVCGLQLTFWEHATSASGHSTDLILAPFSNHCEMLDLLLFAYVIRCLLEHRLHRRAGWLYRAAFVYGLAMTENWAMIGFLPLFVVALAWSKGLRFFNARFLGLMALWGLAGLSLYFLLPIWQRVAGKIDVPFWMAWKTQLGIQRTALADVYRFFSSSKQHALLLALTSLVPIVLISIRWASSFGDNSPMGVWLSTFALRVVQAMFLLACCWVALDPSFSARSKGLGIPCLTLSYLGSLSIAYFSGYFLLVFGKPPPRRSGSSSRSFTRGLARGAVWLLLIVMPAALIYRNLAQIRLSNGPLLEQYAALQAQGLPSEGATLLSDDSRQLALVECYLSQRGRDRQYLFVDTEYLKSPDYQRFLKRRYGSRWPIDISSELKQAIPEFSLMRLISALSVTNTLCYLHPSFGSYFEIFQPEPHGMVYKLNPCPTNSLVAPPVSEPLASENEAFWAKADDQALTALVRVLAPQPQRETSDGVRRLMTGLQLQVQPNPEALLVGAFCSRARNYWGVAAQIRGDLAKAALHFQRAAELNPLNVPAKINLGNNRSLQARTAIPPVSPKVIEDTFGPYRSWERILTENGPFDDPTFCFELGEVFSRGKLYRQAAGQYDRVRVLAPSNLGGRIGLAKMEILRALPDQALDTIAQVHAQSVLVGLTRTNEPDVLLVETAAHLSKRDIAGAEASVHAALLQYPGDENLLMTAARAYLNYGVYSNAISCLKLALAKNPENQTLLLAAAQVYANAGQPREAISCVNAALAKSSANDSSRESLLEAAAQIYLNAGLFTNAIGVLEQEIKLNPESPQSMANLGYASLQIGQVDQAITTLTRALEMDKNNTATLRAYARFNRAIARLRSGKLDDALRDYKELSETWPSAYQIYYGLQEIAYRKKDLPTAARYCQLYLANAPNDTEEARLIAARLKEIKPGSP